MIPKIIHYCWFGRNEKPNLVSKCIDSWKRYCPDYEIIEWNEDNFDLDQNPYIRWCYDHQKWAFLSDFARLLIINENGGIYFDTDVELVQKPDSLLLYEAFYGFENDNYVASGLGFGAEPHHTTVSLMVDEYLKLEPDEDGNYFLHACPELNTKALLKVGLKLNGKKQFVAGALILPREILNPLDDPTGRLLKTAETISIHWYSKTWMDKKTILKSKITRPFHRIFGVDCFRWLKK